MTRGKLNHKNASIVTLGITTNKDFYRDEGDVGRRCTKECRIACPRSYQNNICKLSETTTMSLRYHCEILPRIRHVDYNVRDCAFEESGIPLRNS